MNILKRFFSEKKPHEAEKRKENDCNENNTESSENDFEILQQKHIDQLQSANIQTRTAVIDELSAIGEPIVPDLINALDHWYKWAHSDATSLTFRISITRVLGTIGDVRAIKPIINMAESIEKTSEHREVAAESLARIGTPAIQPMLELLKSDLAAAQQLSAWTLGQIGDPVAIKHLIPMLSTQPFHYPHVRAAANRALKEITQQDFGEDIEIWSNWVKNNMSD